MQKSQGLNKIHYVKKRNSESNCFSIHANEHHTCAEYFMI